MSVEALRWAKAQKPKNATQRAVLMAVAEYANEDGLGWPSQKTLAADMLLTDRTIRTALAGLEAEGLIVRISKRNPDGTRGVDRIQLCFTPEAREKALARAQRKIRPLDQPPENNDQTTGKSFRNHRKSTAEPPEGVSGQEPSLGEPPVGIPHKMNGSEAIASGVGAAVVSADRPIADVLWTDCVQSLIALGETDRDARTTIGQLRKQAGGDDARVFWAVQQAVAIRTGNPRVYCLRLLLPQTDPPPKRGRRSGMVGIALSEFGRLQ